MKKTKILSLASLLLVLVCALTAFTFTACGGSKVKITLSRTEVTVAGRNGEYRCNGKGFHRAARVENRQHRGCGNFRYRRKSVQRKR